MSARKLLLFDIDGTLVTSGGAGETALERAAKERFGIENALVNVEIAGATDSLIVRQILASNAIAPTPENITAFLDSYVEHLSHLLPRHQGGLMPGISGLLETLKARSHLVLALLTGNLCRGARLKLTHYGVWHFFEFGAFADDHEDRNQLGSVAASRARERHGIEFAPESIFVIGDTPRDIACGRAIGANTVAIATGKYSRETLARHQPDFLMDDLSNTASVIATLGW